MTGDYGEDLLVHSSNRSPFALASQSHRNTDVDDAEEINMRVFLEKNILDILPM